MPYKTRIEDFYRELEIDTSFLNEYEQIVLSTIAFRTRKCENGCWEWQGGLMGDGSYPGRVYNERPTRFICDLKEGPLEKKDMACHICDNHICVRPIHLFKGDNQINQLDSIVKSRNSTVGVPRSQEIKDKISRTIIIQYENGRKVPDLRDNKGRFSK